MLGSPEQCPQQLRDSLDLWAKEGILPGSFLQAVLANELRQAFAHGDGTNLEKEVMQNLVSYVYWELPSECHGSRKIIEEWHRKHSRPGAPR